MGESEGISSAQDWEIGLEELAKSEGQVWAQVKWKGGEHEGEGTPSKCSEDRPQGCSPG